MLVLDLADNLLDQIFDGHQPIDPTKLVDHHGDVGPRLAHLDEKVESWQGWCDEQHFAQDRCQLCLLSIRDRRQHVFDVDETDHIVERFAIDGDPRMALLYHTFDYHREGRLDIESDNVDAWHHHVRSRPVVDFENVADQDALMRAERVGTFGGGLLDHFDDRIAQALTVARTPDQPQEVA